MKTKQQTILELLEKSSVFIHLDPRKWGIQVPVQFRKNFSLVLEIGLNMAISIPDLAVDDSGVHCTLTFNRRPEWCSIPWKAVYALIGHEGGGMVWPEDIPPEVKEQQAKKEAAYKKTINKPTTSPVASPPKKYGHLRLVK